MIKRTSAIAIAILCLHFVTVNAQVDTLELNSGLVISPSTCSFLTTGSSQTFFIGASCGSSIVISSDRGVSFVHEVTSEEFAAGTFEYTFDSPGEYVVFCNFPDPDLVITSAACYVVADPVPTTSEWGVVILFLSLSIVCTLVMRTKLAF